MSTLRTALQFAGLDQLRARFVEEASKRREQKIAENERLYTRWLVQMFPGEASLETLVGQVLTDARNYSNFDIMMFDNIRFLGLGWRAETLPSLTPHHQPLATDEIHSALERLFQWTGEQAFAQLHPIEQTALSLARLLEIAPFARLNVPLAGTLSCFWLLRAGFVFPVWEHHQPGKYEEYLDAAFRLEMQPLVDYLLRGEREALRALLES